MELIPEFLEKIDYSNKTYHDYIENYQHTINIENKEKITLVKFINNKDTDFFLKAQYIGVYLVDTNMWVWSWATSISKSLITLSNKLITYALSFEDDKLKRDDFKMIRQFLVNSRMKINYDYNIDILLGMILHITNGKFFIQDYRKLKNQTVIYFYLITDEHKNFL